VLPLSRTGQSTTGCLLDEDCAPGLHCLRGYCAAVCHDEDACAWGEVCDARGRCRAVEVGDTGQASVEAPVWPVLQVTQPTVVVGGGTGLVHLPIVVEGVIPPEGVPILLERDDALLPEVSGSGEATQPGGPNGEDDIARVLRLMPGATGLDVPAGVAHPSAASPRPVTVVGRSPSADLRWDLVPGLASDGLWEGTVRVPSLGESAMSLRVGIRTQPPRASLAAAEAAWLLWPADALSLFSVDWSGPEGALQGWPLERDAEAPDLWVAQPWARMGVEALPGWDGTGAAPRALRSLRVEIEPLGTEEIRGRVVDRWSGLVTDPRRDTRPRDGVVAREGVIRLRRTAETAPEVVLSDGGGSPPALAAQAPPDLSLVCTGSMAWPVECPSTWSATGWASLPVEEAAGCVSAFAAAMSGQPTLESRLRERFADETSTVPVDAWIQRCADGGDAACIQGPEVACLRGLAADLWTRTHAAGRVAEAMKFWEVWTAADDRLHQPLQWTALSASARLREQALQSGAMGSSLAGLLPSWGADLETWSARVEDPLEESVRLQQDHVSRWAWGAVTAQPDREGRVHQALAERSERLRQLIEARARRAERAARLLRTPVAREAAHRALVTELHGLYLSVALEEELQQRWRATWLGAHAAAPLARLVRAEQALRRAWLQGAWSEGPEALTNRQVDPTGRVDTLLAQRRSVAMERVQQAEVGLESLRRELRMRPLEEGELQRRAAEEVARHRSELERLCGVPAGCEAISWQSGRCRPDPAGGRCGALSPDDVGAMTGAVGLEADGTEARGALLQMMRAALAVEEAESMLDMHQQRSAWMLEEMDQSARDLEEWAWLRLQGLLVTGDLLEEMRRERLAAVQRTTQRLEDQVALMRMGLEERMALLDAHEARLVQGAEMTREAMAQRQRLRGEMLAAAQAHVARWDEMRVSGAQTSYREQLAAMQHRARDRRRQRSRTGAFTLLRGLNAMVSSVLSGNWVEAVNGTLNAAEGVTILATRDHQRRAEQADALHRRHASLRDAELQLARDVSGLEQQAGRDQLQAMDESLQLERELLGIDMQRIQNDLVRSREREAVELAALHAEGVLDDRGLELRLAELQADMQRQQLQQQADLAFRQEMAAFRARQLQMRVELSRSVELELRVLAAEQQLELALQGWREVQLRARSIQAALARAEGEVQRVEAWLASALGWMLDVERLEAGERALEEAREDVLAWIAALESLALRPFTLPRIAAWLATSPGELSQVGRELDRLAQTCGGAHSTVRRVVSLRDDLLGLREPLWDPVAERLLLPAERFRAVLGMAPGGFTGRGEPVSRDVRRLRFALDVDRFANLGLACNARWVTLGVEVTGALGVEAPVLRLVHEGTGQLRSCQPDALTLAQEDSMQAWGFGPLTLVRSSPLQMAPVAALHRGVTDSDRNRSWEGLPLSADYTLVIDPAQGANRALRWDALEDVVLHIEYVHQDLFPASACR
jgi:hypothetical protein